MGKFDDTPGVWIEGKFHPRPQSSNFNVGAIEDFLFGEVLQPVGKAASRGAGAQQHAQSLQSDAIQRGLSSLMSTVGSIPFEKAAGIQSNLEGIKSDASSLLAENLFGSMGELGEGVSGAGSVLQAIMTLDEENPVLPDSLKQVGKSFQGALDTTSREFGGGESNRGGDADAQRHILGAREATISAGILPTLAGSLGHELKNMLGALSGKFKQLGTERDDVSLIEAAENSYMDIHNNMLGILSALMYPGDITPEQMQQFDAAAVKAGALE